MARTLNADFVDVTTHNLNTNNFFPKCHPSHEIIEGGVTENKISNKKERFHVLFIFLK